MQIFGIISLLIVLALAGVWVTSSLGPVGEGGTATESTYQKALDSAHEVAGSVSDDVSLSSKSVFVYDGISVPDDTKVLDLSGKGLNGSLKAEIRHLTSLRELDLSDNNFTGLPAEVGQLSALEVLNLSNNPITGLPHELGSLKNLKVLDLRGTQYSSQDLVVIKSNLPVTTNILVD